MTLSIKLDPEVKRQLEEIANTKLRSNVVDRRDKGDKGDKGERVLSTNATSYKQQNTSLNRLVLRYISQGIQADTGEPDRLAAIEARLDAIAYHHKFS